jgi:hypothetical protein
VGGVEKHRWVVLKNTSALGRPGRLVARWAWLDWGALACCCLLPTAAACQGHSPPPPPTPHGPSLAARPRWQLTSGLCLTHHHQPSTNRHKPPPQALARYAGHPHLAVGCLSKCFPPHDIGAHEQLVWAVLGALRPAAAGQALVDAALGALKGAAANMPGAHGASGAWAGGMNILGSWAWPVHTLEAGFWRRLSQAAHPILDF